MLVADRRKILRTSTLSNARRTGPTTREMRGDFDPATLLTQRPRTRRR